MNNHYAGVIVERKDGKILAIKHHKRGWTIPGGKVTEGEHPREAAKRELYEETGLNFQIVTYLGQSVATYDGVTWNGDIYECKLWSGQDEPKLMEPHKFTGLDWKTLEEFIEVAPHMRPELQLVRTRQVREGFLIHGCSV